MASKKTPKEIGFKILAAFPEAESRLAEKATLPMKRMFSYGALAALLSVETLSSEEIDIISTMIARFVTNSSEFTELKELFEKTKK